MWCRQGRHRSCRCLLVAVSSRRRLLEAAGSSCGALPYCVSPLPAPCLPAAAAELTVSPGSNGALAGRRRPASVLPAPDFGAAPGHRGRVCGWAGRGARRRLSRDAPGHFCPKALTPARGVSAARGLDRVWAPPGCRTVESAAPRGVRSFFLKGTDHPGAGVALRKPRRVVPSLRKAWRWPGGRFGLD